jgi:hypothetical protein
LINKVKNLIEKKNFKIIFLLEMKGLLHVGDIIKEINGEIVNTPEELQDKLRNARGAVTFKVVPSYYDYPSPSQVKD